MERPNILFAVMDTARAKDSLPSENREVVPNLAKLADSGVEFTSAISNAPWTLPSHASMFSGQYTTEHGTNAGDMCFELDYPTLPEAVNKSGYTTVAFSNNSWISPEFGFERGFNQFYKGWELLSSDQGLAKIMREEDTAIDQLHSLIDTTGLKSLPVSLANAFYTRFIRKKYDYGAYVTNLRVKRWINNEYNGKSPFFMFLNYLEPHLKYDPPKKFCEFLPEGVTVSEAKEVSQDPWGYVSGDIEMTAEEFEILESLYKSEINYLDYRIGNLLDFFSDRDILDETLVIVIGDHGENIGEHGLMDHQYSVHDTLVHVPLVMKGPDVFTGGERVSEPVEARDLFPTIIDATNAEMPKNESISQNNLYETVEASDGNERVAISEYLVPRPAIEKLREQAPDPVTVDKYDRALRAIRMTEWKYIEGSDGTAELYDLSSDSDESTNVVSSNPEIVEELEAILFEELGNLERGDSVDGQLEQRTQQRLEDLGYI
ncbi:sulfatase-like hydrolase/transferase [Halobium palmae]|uniref:Sulfatase-like hydrolase/transferase n=1 Tax=Halobium palmae TaxID=1776492 RepID=A0ABD5RUM4_9EURY